MKAKHEAAKKGVKAKRQPALKGGWQTYLVRVGNGCGFVALVALPLYYGLGALELGAVGGWLRVGVAVVGFASVVLALVGFAGVMLMVGVYDRGVKLWGWVRRRQRK